MSYFQTRNKFMDTESLRPASFQSMHMQCGLNLVKSMPFFENNLWIHGYQEHEVASMKAWTCSVVLMSKINALCMVYFIEASEIKDNVNIIMDKVFYVQIKNKVDQI